MHTRQNVLSRWLEENYPHTAYTLNPLTGDASFRSYFRLSINNKNYILMDAPPDKEPLQPFISICDTLRQKGVHAPLVERFDLENGFALLEDFGDVLLLKKLTSENADLHYKKGMDILLQIQTCATNALPQFNKTYMHFEISLFNEWFLGKYLEIALPAAHKKLLEESFSNLVNIISTQPQVFIHRDYHSRNLMVVSENPLDLGVIDFQDAMLGPIAYDLVSLLKDCYIQWPREQTLKWLNYFYNQLDINLSEEEFIRFFDFCGLQRHLKVLGIFCRLHFRDHKSAYLNDLPLIFNYVMACLECYEELKPLHSVMQDVIYPAFLRKTQS